MIVPTKRLTHKDDKENKNVIIVNVSDVPEYVKKGFSEVIERGRPKVETPKKIEPVKRVVVK